MDDGRELFLNDLQPLFAGLAGRGRVIGPRVRDGALVVDELQSPEDLPRGWVDKQEAGRHRLAREGDALFGFTLAPESFKRFLYPPRLALWELARAPARVRAVREPVQPFTLLGLRACDLAAIRVLDRVLLEGERVDGDYRRRRGAALLVAVACTRAAPTCFCVSAGGDPRPEAGYDLLLTELEDGFLVAAGSPPGEQLLSGLHGRKPTGAELAAAAEGVERARHQRRALPEGIGQGLRARLEDPRWAAIAERCLGCGNCTMVCPTCFCTSAEQALDLEEQRMVQSRRWDSCFAPGHSYVHGGAVRASLGARYRQWLIHKLSTWQEQFGTSGCVGCGRCITWCPAAIDISEEARLLIEAGGTQKKRALTGARGGDT